MAQVQRWHHCASERAGDGKFSASTFSSSFSATSFLTWPTSFALPSSHRTCNSRNLCMPTTLGIQKYGAFYHDSEFFSTENVCLPRGKLSISRNSSSKRSAVRVLKAFEGSKSGRFYINITGFPFPLGPFLKRLTIRTEVDRGRIWLFEQEQALGFSNVSTNIRMTVIKLKSGGLWVHAPIAPTRECIQLLNELGAPVEYIILPTFAYEHKIFVGPFSRKYPKAQIWVAPRQWSWPLNLPLQFFGIFKARLLVDEDSTAPWVDEIEQKVLSCPEVGIGPYVEVAFYHKQSQSLLVTDAVICVPQKPPIVVPTEALLSAAKNGLAVKLLSAGKDVSDDPIIDCEATRQRGWERMVLQILFLGPSNLLEPKQSFTQISRKLIVSPIVKTLVFNKVPDKVRVWVDTIARDWKFKQIIPCHFVAPVVANSRQFKLAFSFLDDLLIDDFQTKRSAFPRFTLPKVFERGIVFLAADMKTLSSLDDFLVSVRAVKKTVFGRKRA